MEVCYLLCCSSAVFATVLACCSCDAMVGASHFMSMYMYIHIHIHTYVIDEGINEVLLEVMKI